jgi:hypothetical protein
MNFAKGILAFFAAFAILLFSVLVLTFAVAVIVRLYVAMCDAIDCTASG